MRQVDPDTLRRMDGNERQRGAAVDGNRQRLRARRPGRNPRVTARGGQAPPGIGNARRPAARIAGASLGETLARVARARQKAIRPKYLRFLELRPGIQAITGRRRRIGGDFRHQRGSRANGAKIWVHDTFSSRPQLGHPARIQVGWGHRPAAFMASPAARYGAGFDQVNRQLGQV